jgi:membrane associated rhomboid family serine protease
MGRKLRLDFNAPVILSLTATSLAILIASKILGDGINRFFAIRFTSYLDPLMYMRLFTHVLVHSSLDHYFGNFLLILAVGPMIEEKYGSQKMLMMVVITALVTGILNVLFFKNIMLMGASGLCFMLILIASFTNVKSGSIPVTFLLVGAVYLGQEVIAGLSADNISQMAHIIGGVCGSVFGATLKPVSYKNY